MRLEPMGTEVADGLLVEATGTDGDVVRWSVANDTAGPLAVDRVRLRWRLAAEGPVRLFRHGYQSWSVVEDVVVGSAEDPSRAEGSIGLVRGWHHADAAVAAPGELRSELVTVVADDDGATLLGFDGGDRHDGTFRVLGDHLVAEAFLGGAVLAPGERRALHDIRIESGDRPALLERWASWAGAASGARTGAPFQVGWCSWYQFFHDVTEHDVRSNLAAAGEWPFDVFQVDDGYQAAIGDWLLPHESFSTPLDGLAADIAAAGHVPGLWLAPTLVSPSSVVAAEHPDWLATHRSGRPLVGNDNPGWLGHVHVLDPTHPEAEAHLEELARTLVAMGWRYLKLDFTYAPSLDGTYHDPSKTPAERVRMQYDAVRRGAGDDVFILGCGAPLGPCIGAVDGMRIGPDVAPSWEPTPSTFLPPGYEGTTPATGYALRNTEARAFQHRRLWLNDPDCVMLRTDGTDLTPAQVEAWAHAVGESGGMVIVSDDLPALDHDAHRLLDEVLEAGRAADAAALARRP